MTNKSSIRNTFALKFHIDWEYIDVIRSFVNSFLQKTLSDNKTADKLSMAVSELLENAVKYGIHKEDGLLHNIHIQLDTFKEEKKVVFFIENMATSENIDTLKTQLESVNIGDPKEMYVRKIRESLTKEDKSQLGLARIRYEAGGEIFLDIKKDNRVRLQVVFSV
jgi:hypothetical protein